MAGTFNQSLQCTQDVFIGFQAPSPPVTVTQIATKYRREARSSDARIARAEHELELEQVEAVVPELHHNISHSQNSPPKLRNFLWKTPGDPAKKVGPHIEN